jgi:hypothetical protein
MAVTASAPKRVAHADDRDPVAGSVEPALQQRRALVLAGLRRLALVEDDGRARSGRLGIVRLHLERAGATLDERDGARREAGEVRGLAARVDVLAGAAGSVGTVTRR